MKRNIIILAGLLFCLTASAHSGRIDGQGGHRVNKKWEYNGKYLVLENGVRLAREGKVTFYPGDYHYHVHPNYIPDVKDGIFLPIKSKGIKKTRTDIIYVSDENRVASNKSNVYHKIDCRHISRIKEENAIVFEDFEDAEKNEYVPCGHCKPDVLEVAE